MNHRLDIRQAMDVKKNCLGGNIVKFQLCVLYFSVFTFPSKVVCCRVKQTKLHNKSMKKKETGNNFKRFFILLPIRVWHSSYEYGVPYFPLFASTMSIRVWVGPYMYGVRPFFTKTRAFIHMRMESPIRVWGASIIRPFFKNQAIRVWSGDTCMQRSFGSMSI